MRLTGRFFLLLLVASVGAVAAGAGISGASGRGPGLRPPSTPASSTPATTADAPAADTLAPAAADNDPDPIYGLVGRLGVKLPQWPQAPQRPQLPAAVPQGIAQILSQALGMQSWLAHSPAHHATPPTTGPPPASSNPSAPTPPTPSGTGVDQSTGASFDDPVVSVGTRPAGVAIAGTKAYVANTGSDTVSVVDISNPASPNVMATIPVGTFPIGVAASPDGTRVYVTNFRSNNLSIINTATNTVVATVGVGTKPDGVVQAGTFVYVANLTGNSISVMDTSTATVTATVTLGGTAAPSGLAVNAAGTRLYINDARNGTLLVYNLTVSPPAVLSSSTTLGALPAYISVIGTTGYVANPGSNTVSVVDLAASPPTVTATVNVGTADYGIVALSALNEVLVSNSASNNVTVIDTVTNTVVGSPFAVGNTPNAIAVASDGTAVITNSGDNNVSVFHVNLPPTLTVPGAQTVNANGSGNANKLTFSTANLNVISAADADAGGNPVKATLSVTHGVLTLSGVGGLTLTSGANGSAAMAFTGTLTSVNAALQGMSFTPTTTYIGPAALSFSVDDQGNTGVGQPETATAAVNITVQNVAPVVNNVSFTGAVGNTIFGVGGSAPAQPSTSTSGTVLSGSSDANSDTLTVTAGSITSTGNGKVVMASGGTFTYITAPGFAGSSDTFIFTVTDGHGGSTNGTATVNISGRVWYADDSLGVNGNGTSISPFNTLSNLNGAVSNVDSNGDFIFLFTGNANYAGGLPLQPSQTLIGQPQNLVVGTQTLWTGTGTNPVITNSGGVGITLANDTVIRRVNVTGTSSAGMQGSAVTNVDIGTNITVSNASGAGIGFLNAAAGNITVAANITHSNASARSFFVSNRSGGTVTMSGTINDTAGGVQFSSNTGATINLTGALTISAATETFKATGGGTVTATNTANTLSSTVGSALSVTGTSIGAGGLKFQSISSNGAANGIILNGTGSAGGLTVTGTGTTAGSGGTIQVASGDGISLTNVGAAVSLSNMATTNVAGIDVLVDGGAGSVTYAGTITNQSGKGQSVVVRNKTGGTVAFSGAVSDNGTGLSLTNNAGATINFTGGLTMSTGANPAFAATGGGTVNVTGSANTITTTTATALNIASTTIGSSNVTFRSITAGTAASGPASGILLSSTGAAGGLTVTGTGSAGTGGTIQKTSNSGIDANGTNNLNLSWMAFANNGDALNEGGVRLQEVTGTGQFTSSTITGAFEDGFFLKNTTGTLTSFKIQGPSCSITNNNTSSGNDGINVQSATTAVMSVTIDNCAFSGNRSDTMHPDAADSSSLTVAITNNTITAGTAGNNQGNIGIDVSGAIASTLNYTINNNKVGTPDGTTNSHLIDTGVNVFTAGTSSSAVGTVTNNTVFGPGPGNSGWGIRVATGSGSTGRSRVQGNAVHNLGFDDGILIDIGLNASSTASAQVGVISNNVENAPASGLDGIRVIVHNSGVGCLKIASNVGQTGGPNDDLVLRVSNSGTFKLDGGTPSGAMTAAQAQTYAAAQNSSATTSASAGASPANYQGVAANTCNIP